MSSRSPMAINRRHRRWITFTWTAVLTVLIIGLIYWEKTALLYILATLGVAALLTVVALADLGGPKKNSSESTANTDMVSEKP